MSRRPRPSLKPRSRGTRPVMYSNSWPALWACIPHATISDAAPLTSELKKNKPVRAKICQGQILALTSALWGWKSLKPFELFPRVGPAAESPRPVSYCGGVMGDFPAGKSAPRVSAASRAQTLHPSPHTPNPKPRLMLRMRGIPPRLPTRNPKPAAQDPDGSVRSVLRPNSENRNPEPGALQPPAGIQSRRVYMTNTQ